ncbi:MAG: hypothetical protein ABWZ25_10150 [Chitinophagaceae bacterium]
MTLVERVNLYITQLCDSIGVSAEKVYHPTTNAWYFSNGTSTIEVFLSNQKSSDGQSETFIRCMAPLCQIPMDIMKQFAMFRTVLQINAKYMGFKITADEERGIFCIVSERNISGMDYDEMVSMIDGLGHWADKLDKFLVSEFAVK